jgi:tight adherence protein C
MTLTTQALLALFCGGVFLSVFVASYTLAVAPIAPGTRLGVRGLKRSRALQTNAAFAQLEPVMRWLAARVKPLVKGELRTKIDQQIMLAGDFWGLTPDDYVALSIMSCGCGFLLAALFKTALHQASIWIMIGGPFGAAVPYFQLSRYAESRLKRIQNGLPYAIDLIALALSAGLDFPGAIRQVVDKTSDPNDPLTEELNFILQELQIGKTRKQALIEFRTRVPGDSVREFVSAVVQAEERGNPLAEVLRIQATSSRQRRSVRAEEQAAKAGLKILVPCLFVFAAVVLLIVSPLFLKIQPLLAN